MVFVPLLVRLEIGLERGGPEPVRLALRVWGLPLLRFPGKRSRRSAYLTRWILRQLDKFLTPGPDSSKEPASPRPSRKPIRWNGGFLRWAASRLLDLGARLTRRLQVRCGGIDPALLGSLTGVAGIVRGLLGTRRFEWLPDFSPSDPRIEIRWDLSLSVWKLVRWTGESFLDRNRHPDPKRDL